MTEVTRLLLKTAFPIGCEILRIVDELSNGDVTVVYNFRYNQEHDTTTGRMLEDLGYIKLLGKNDLTLTIRGARWLEQTLREFGGRGYEFPSEKRR